MLLTPVKKLFDCSAKSFLLLSKSFSTPVKSKKERKDYFDSSYIFCAKIAIIV
jgi:hypothetical protein